MSPTIFLTCFFLYIAAMIAFGWWVSRKNKSGDDFLLGGRSLPLFLTLGTTLATMVGTGSSMGAVGKAYEAGWLGSLYGLGGAMGIFIAAWLFAPMRRHRFMTMAEELSSYVGANRIVTNLVGVFTFLSSVGWLGVHILGGGMYLRYATGMPPVWSMVIVALGFGIYAIIGGYLAVVWTDTIQAVVLFVGFIATAGYAFFAVGGWDGLQEIHSRILADNPGAASVLPAVSLIVVIAVGVLGTPSFRQRIYSGNSVPEVRKAFVGSGLLYLGFALLPAVIGMATYDANPSLSNKDQDMAFPWMANQVLPLALGMLVLLAGLSATMSSASSDAVSGVTTVIRDLYRSVTGRMPPADKVILFSRIALALTTLLALGMALTADNIIKYIEGMIAMFLSGMCVCGVLGRLWPRFNAAGAIAALVAAFATALTFRQMEIWNSYWGNSVIPSLLVSSTAGIVVSLLTRPDSTSHEQALEQLRKERESMQSG